MVYTGDQYTFDFPPLNVNKTCGIVAPDSIIEAGNTFFYMDEDGFYRGTAGDPIGAEKVNRSILEEMDTSVRFQVRGASDPVSKMVWWLIPKNDGTNFMLGYDWQLDEWARIDVDMRFIADGNIPAYTLEGLNALYPDLDAMTISLDSRIFYGGAPTFAGVDADDKFGFFAGTPYAAQFITNVVALAGPDQFALVTGFRAITDASTHTARVGTRDQYQENVTYGSTLTPESVFGAYDCMVDAKLFNFEINIPAGETWDVFHGVDVTPQNSGGW